MIYQIIPKYLKMQLAANWLQQHPLSAHHIESFLEWQHFGLLKTLRAQCIFGKTKNWKIANAQLEAPITTPQYCIERNLTYFSRLLVDWNETKNDGTIVQIKDFELAQIPMIVMPHLAADNIGGYFVIKGSERAIVTQLRTAYNQPICSLNKQDLKKNRIRAEQNGNAKQDTTAAEIRVRSISEASGHSCQSDMYLTRLDQCILESIKFKGRVNVGVAMKLLGCNEMQDFVWATGCNETAHLLWLSSLVAADQNEANEILTRQLGTDATKLLLFDVWPHLGLTATNAICCRYMGSLAERIVRARREKKGDNRDALRFKRFEAAGHLIAELFEQIFKRWCSQEQKRVFARDNLIIGIHGVEFITKALLYCFSTGTWGAPFSKFSRLGVCQMRCNLSYLSYLAHVRRCSNPQSRETKNLLVRQLDSSEWGYVCPLDSPEGAKIGIVKNLSIAANITRHTVQAHVMDALLLNCTCLSTIAIGIEGAVLILNGRPTAMCNNVELLIETFINLRRLGWFDSSCSIGIDGRDVLIWTDAGRIVRPVWTRGAIKTGTDWNIEFDRGNVQLIDPFESEFCGQFDDNQQIDDGLMFGISAATIPLLNFQPPVRGLFGAAMIKQAVSLLGPSQHNRLDTTLHVSHKTQKPLVVTKSQMMLGLDNYPLGTNLLVAVAPIDGYNQDDAVVVNQHSVDRGLFSGSLIKTHQVEESCDGSCQYKVCLPEIQVRHDHVNYCLLENDGLPKLGAKFEVGDAMIGLVSRSFGKSHCNSLICGKGEEGTVIKVVKTVYLGNLIIKIQVEKQLRFMAGDKTASRYSQKGICGKLMTPDKLPFAADGTVPDIIINPLCLPSRMTLTALIECIFGIECLETGQRAVLNAFENKTTIEDLVNRIMANRGTDNPYGQVAMYHPVTLKQRTVFMGVGYYLWLAHFAEPKCYARDTGIRSKLKRQPTDGRSRQGGLRFGEMDRDVCVTMPGILDDRLFWSSDAFWIPVCKNCNQVAINKKICLCGSNNISMTKLAFTNHMVFNLMRAAGCRLNFFIEPPKHLAIVETKIEKDLFSTDNKNSADDQNNEDESSDDESSDDEIINVARPYNLDDIFYSNETEDCDDKE